jgi:N,N'-diacetyllegionaminate synthase
MFGPDVPASITPLELAQLVQGIDSVHRALSTSVDKDMAAAELADMRDLFTRSVALSRDLQAGTVLREDDLALKKPGTGIPPERLPGMVGRRLTRDVRADELLREEDFE